MATQISVEDFNATFPDGSTTTAISSRPRPVPTSLPYWLAWLFNIVCYAGMAGVIGLVLNLTIIRCVVKNKKFQSRFYIIVGFLSLTRALTSAQYIVFGVHRSWTLVDPWAVYQTRLACDLLSWVFYYSITDVILLIFMVVDRMVAILQPTFYRLLSKKQAVLSGVVILIVSFLAHVVPLFVDVDLMAVVTCSNAQSGASARFSAFCNYEPLVLTVLLLVLQLSAIASTYRRLKRARQAVLDNENSVFLKRQSELMRALRNMVFSHSVLTLFCRVCLMLFGAVPSLALYFLTVVGVVQSMDIFSAPIILLCSKKELREACLPSRYPTESDKVYLNAISKNTSSSHQPKPEIVDMD